MQSSQGSITAPAAPASGSTFLRWGPALTTLVCLTILILYVVLMQGGDPLALARLGTRYSLGDPAGTEGYDGQFVYYIARQPDPQLVASQLDVPAYRYQRILLPLLARSLSLLNPAWLPWMIVFVGILSQAAGTWAVGELLERWGTSRWYALVYGMWAGFSLALRLDLPEPLAYALVAMALLALEGGRKWPGWALLGLALFAKEVTILFVAAQGLAYLFGRRWKDMLGLGIISILPYALFQLWLLSVFGQPGIGSGGAMATPFEWIPYMGLLRIGAYSLVYLVAMVVVFGPSIILPSAWGIISAARKLLATERNVIVLSLFFNGLAVAAMPFSTFRETGGVLRFACGLVLAVLLYGGRYHYRRVLNYSPLWLVLNVFIFK